MGTPVILAPKYLLGLKPTKVVAQFQVLKRVTISRTSLLLFVGFIAMFASSQAAYAAPVGVPACLIQLSQEFDVVMYNCDRRVLSVEIHDNGEFRLSDVLPDGSLWAYEITLYSEHTEDSKIFRTIDGAKAACEEDACDELPSRLTALLRGTAGCADMPVLGELRRKSYFQFGDFGAEAVAIYDCGESYLGIVTESSPVASEMTSDYIGNLTCEEL